MASYSPNCASLPALILELSLVELDETSLPDWPPALGCRGRAIQCSSHRDGEQNIQSHCSVDPLLVSTLAGRFLHVFADLMIPTDGQMFEVRAPVRRDLPPLTHLVVCRLQDINVSCSSSTLRAVPDSSVLRLPQHVSYSTPHT